MSHPKTPKNARQRVLLLFLTIVASCSTDAFALHSLALSRGRCPNSFGKKKCSVRRGKTGLSRGKPNHISASVNYYDESSGKDENEYMIGKSSSSSEIIARGGGIFEQKKVLTTEEVESKMDDVLSRIGVSFQQVALALFAAVIYAADAAEITSCSLVSQSLVEKWNLEMWQRGLLGSSLYSGMFAGSFMCGPIADTIGRKKSIMISTSVMSVFGLLGCVAPSYGILCAIKWFLGVGVGSSLPIASTLLQESLPKNVRVAVSCLVFAGFNIGEMYIAKISAKAIASGRQDLSALLFLFAAIPNILTFFASLVVPESPRFLAIKRRKLELSTLIKRAGKNSNKSVEYVLDAKDVDGAVEELCSSKSIARPKNFVHGFLDKMKDVLGKGVRTKTLLIASLWMSCNFLFYGLIFALPDLLQAAKDTSGLATFSPADAIIEINRYQILSIFVSMLAVSAGIGAHTIFTVGFAVSVAVFFYASTMFTSPLKMTAVLALGKSVQNGLFVLLYPFTGESFPTKMRCSGTSLCSTAGRLTGVFIAPFITFLMSKNNLLPLKTFAGISMLAGISSLLLQREEGESNNPAKSAQPL